MLDIAEIARLEEQRLATVFREIGREALSYAGGTAARGEPGAWTNCIVGAGMGQPADCDELERICRWYQVAGIEPRVEVCPYADPSLIAAVARLDFVLRDFDTVLYRLLDDEPTPVRERPAGLTIERIDPADARQVRAYSAVVVPQFLPQGAVREADLELSDQTLRHPRTIALAACMDGRIVGGGGLEVVGAVATLWGLAVDPAYRRRGIQQSLIAERLRLAREHGARVATIGSRPGQGTERNVRRMGFQTAYTKVTVVRPGPGLAPVLS